MLIDCSIGLFRPFLRGYRLNAGDNGQNFTFPSFTLKPAASTLIGANITGVNTARYPCGVVAPAAEIAAEEAAAGEELGSLNLDALEQFGSKRTESGAEGVSPAQSELNG